MEKLKIVVYAICLNEEKFVNRWYESMKEPDEIVVLDTGSTDKTVEKLKSHGIKVVSRKITPWRFDKARNISLALVPNNADVCVCTDLDEVFEKGWREKIEQVWIKSKTQQMHYKYVWNVENGQDKIAFVYEKIHARHGFSWIYPVHEILSHAPLVSTQICTNLDLILRHFPDENKSRKQYLNLLELSVKEHPESDRNTHYLAREYMFNKRFADAIEYFKKHLSMPNSTWTEERSASERYMADCYLKLGKNSLAHKHYKLAIIESPNTREPYFSLALFYYNKKDYSSALVTLLSMLKITTRTLSYISNSDLFGELPYDYIYMSFYYLKNYKKALEYCKIALSFVPNDQRINQNLAIFEKLCNK